MQKTKDRWSVGQWMTPAPRTIPAETTASRAFYQMCVEGFRHLLVTKNNVLLGIISDRDMHMVQIKEGPDGWIEAPQQDSEGDVPVSELMSKDVKTVNPEDTLEKALKMMIFHKIGALPVIDQGSHIVGILSTQDVMAAFAATLDDFGGAMRQSVSIEAHNNGKAKK